MGLLYSWLKRKYCAKPLDWNTEDEEEFNEEQRKANKNKVPPTQYPYDIDYTHRYVIYFAFTGSMWILAKICNKFFLHHPFFKFMRLWKDEWFEPVKWYCAPICI